MGVAVDSPAVAAVAADFLVAKKYIAVVYLM